MTIIRNLEGQWVKQATADLVHRGRFVGRLSVVTEAGVQRLTARDLDRNIIASHEQPKGLPWGTDQIEEWVDGLDFAGENRPVLGRVDQLAQEAGEAEARLRAAVVEAVAEGCPVAPLARAAGVTRPTVYRWVDAAK